jgi:hypothetical protein
MGEKDYLKGMSGSSFKVPQILKISESLGAVVLRIIHEKGATAKSTFALPKRCHQRGPKSIQITHVVGDLPMVFKDLKQNSPKGGGQRRVKANVGPSVLFQKGMQSFVEECFAHSIGTLHQHKRLTGPKVLQEETHGCRMYFGLEE